MKVSKFMAMPAIMLYSEIFLGFESLSLWPIGGGGSSFLQSQYEQVNNS